MMQVVPILQSLINNQGNFEQHLSFMIEGFWYPIGPRAWGCHTALAGLWRTARWFYRAYLALHPHARLWFFGVFPVFERYLIENEEVLGLASDSMQFIDTAMICIVTNA